MPKPRPLAERGDSTHTPGEAMVDCIHHLFEAQARERPGAVAVESPEASLTYGELDARAEALAGALRAAGVGKDVKVGLLADRSPELFIGILAVLKAGGAYLCLDPLYPEERLLQIWQDLKAPVLLTTGEQAGRLPIGAARVIRLDKALPAFSSAKGAAPGPKDLAYLIFTSGSTGRPKGILLEHRGLSNLIRWTNGLLDLGPGDRLLQFAALSFDVSVWETFMALCSGATLVLPGPSDRFLAPALHKILQERTISVALLPPSLMALMPTEGLGGLRAVISVGERLATEVVRRWARGRRLINGYGPAEATITVSAFETQADAEYPRLGPPIGRAIPNVQLHVLGPDLEPVDHGETGEIFIGGIGVARGYLDRPELDREKFLADHFRAPGDRLYRTGDLARRLPGGDLEFLGRADTQVKVHGIRVELGEVEAVLRLHPHVSEAVVVLKQEKGRPRLVAFVAFGGREEPAPASLRRHAQELLPRTMVPHDFLVVKELPRTPNGKLDRKALETRHA